MLSETNTDVVILTALLKERDAVLRHVNKPKEILSGKNRCYHALVPSSTPEADLNIIVMCLENMGNISSAIATAHAIDAFNPAYVVLAGIAGGIKNDTNRFIGDVLVGEQVVYYETGKQETGRLTRRYQVYRPAKTLLDAARSLLPQNWAFSGRVSRPDGTSNRVIPKVHFGVVASGEKVVKDSTLTSELKDDWAQLIGIEMEAAGAGAAAYELGGMPGILVAKSICDWADSEKNDTWQEYAADTSATYVLALLQRLTVPERTRPIPRYRESVKYTGRVKLRVCGRLTSDWQDLADYFQIPKTTRARFEKGREPHGVWEWLEERKKLQALKDALEFIERQDLIEELSL